MLNRVQFHAAVSPHSTWSSLRACLGSVFRVDDDNVPLQILLEVVDIEHPKLLIPAYVASSGIAIGCYAMVIPPYLRHRFSYSMMPQYIIKSDFLCGQFRFLFQSIKPSSFIAAKNILASPFELAFLVASIIYHGYSKS